MTYARALLALTLASVVVSCNSSDAVPGNAAGAAGASSGGASGAASTGGAGDGGGIPIVDAGKPEKCAWPLVAGDAGMGGDGACDGSVKNAPDCPASVPEPGSACTSESVCLYEEEPPHIVQSRCSAGTWTNVPHTCSDECAEPDAGALDGITVAVPGTCGSEEVSCGPESFLTLTDLEQLRFALSKIASCCLALEVEVRVTFAGGCATTVTVGPQSFAKPDVAECVAKSLAGKRIDCALTQSCASVVLTTLK